MKQLEQVWQCIERNSHTWKDTFKGSPHYGQPLVAQKVNLYQTNDHIIKPQTEAFQCSYVELIAAGPQVPTWFVSHWWGEPVWDFLACVAEHSVLRHLDDKAGYWVCAYANNQWKLDEEIETDPAKTSFRKAMSLSRGTLSVVDSGALTYTRIWCSYEVSVTLLDMGPDYHYDIATALQDETQSERRAVILTDGPTLEDEEQGLLDTWEHRGGAHGHQLAREKTFPVAVFRKSFAIELENGQASVEQDRQRILNSIAGQDLAAIPAKRHARYNEANEVLRWRFGMGFLHVAGELGLENEKKDILATPEPRGKYGEVALKTYSKKAITFKAIARFDLALAMAKNALEIRVRTLGPDHKAVGASYCLMALVYNEQGKDDLALEHHEKSLAILLKALGPDHPDVGSSYSNMANVYKAQGKLDLALEHYQKNLAIWLKALGPDHPDVAMGYNNMAIVYDAQGKLDLALEHYQKSLAIRLKALGPDHPDVGSSYNNMALVYEAQGKLDLALEHHEKSLAICLKALGPDHPEVGDGYNNMARVYRAQENMDLAVEHDEKSLAIRLKALGPEHPKVGDSCHKLAKAYQAQGKMDLALDYGEKNLAVWLKTLGPDHPAVGECYNNMACVYRAQGKMDLALERYEKSLAIFLGVLGPDDPHVGLSYMNIAGVYRAQGKMGLAREHYLKAASIYQVAYGGEHDETKDALRRARINDKPCCVLS